MGVGRRLSPGGRETHAEPIPPEVCAETHCSVLVKKGTVFEECHATVNPKPFYKVGGAVGGEAVGEVPSGIPGGQAGGRHPQPLSARRGVCTKPVTTRRRSRTSVLP